MLDSVILQIRSLKERGVWQWKRSGELSPVIVQVGLLLEWTKITQVERTIDILRKA